MGHEGGFGGGEGGERLGHYGKARRGFSRTETTDAQAERGVPPGGEDLRGPWISVQSWASSSQESLPAPRPLATARQFAAADRIFFMIGYLHFRDSPMWANPDSVTFNKGTMD